MGLAGKIKADPAMSGSAAPTSTPAQVAAPQQPQYGAPPQQQYGAPPQQQYGAPPQQYGLPPQQQYGAPPQQYGLPPQQQHGAPPQQYGVQGVQQQQQHGYGAPNYGAAPQQQYGTPQQHGSTPQQQYGAPSQQQYGAPRPPQQQFNSNTGGILATKLQRIIRENRLETFYDANRFQSVLQKVSTVNFDEIASRWKISKELAYDLAPLALYDIAFYCDDSGSMAFEEDGERIEDLKFILAKVSDVATMFDDDGIVVRFMNSNVNGDGIHNSAEAATLVSRVNFSGMTPLGTNFDRKIVEPFVLGQANAGSMAKPVLAIIITDGEPSGEPPDTIKTVIRRAKDALGRSRFGPGALAIQIAQVGKDLKTQQFLAKLDNDPVVGNMIDCTSYFEMEAEEFARKGVTLTPELWLLKMCVGAIDREYDESDN